MLLYVRGSDPDGGFFGLLRPNQCQATSPESGAAETRTVSSVRFDQRAVEID